MIRGAWILAAAFVAALAVFFTTRDEDAPATPVERPVLTGTAADIGPLRRAVRSGRDDLRPALAQAYMSRARETGDTGFYAKAEAAIGRPRTQEGYAVASEVAAARHHFTRALELGARAGRVGAAIRVDSFVELGRYDEAERELQAMIDRRPDLAGYARASYLRELHGDLDGAAHAMRLAIAAGGPTAENAAYVRALLGGIELRRGNEAAARRAYREALAFDPGFSAAEEGLARIGDDLGALRALAKRLPDLDHLIAVGETELSRGLDPAATFARLQQRRRQIERTADTDIELAVYEADHGDPAQALALARRGYRDTPSVRAADALGWALTRSGRPQEGLRYAREALRLGSVEPLWLAHAGLTRAAAGQDGRRELRQALAHGLDAYPWQAQRVRRALQ